MNCSLVTVIAGDGNEVQNFFCNFTLLLICADRFFFIHYISISSPHRKTETYCINVTSSFLLPLLQKIEFFCFSQLKMKVCCNVAPM